MTIMEKLGKLLIQKKKLSLFLEKTRNQSEVHKLEVRAKLD